MAHSKTKLVEPKLPKSIVAKGKKMSGPAKSKLPELAVAAARKVSMPNKSRAAKPTVVVTKKRLKPTSALVGTKPSPPTTEDEYVLWAKDFLNIDLASKASSDLYELNVRVAHAEVTDKDFTRGLNAALVDLVGTYKEGKRADLFLSPGEPPSVELLKKPYSSVVNKMFRRNVVLNQRWPEPPDGGWVTLDNIYSVFDDLLRTTITTKFLDGPEFVVAGLKSFADREKLTTHERVHSREEGYYAHHLYVEFLVLLASVTGPPASRKIFVELQVTTHTQDLLRKLTYQYYRKERSLAERDGAWKWDYRSRRFRARYLSHTFHLLESLILEARDDRDAK